MAIAKAASQLTVQVENFLMLPHRKSAMKRNLAAEAPLLRFLSGCEAGIRAILRRRVHINNESTKAAVPRVAETMNCGPLRPPPSDPPEAADQHDMPPLGPAPGLWPDRGLTQFMLGLGALSCVVGSAAYLAGSTHEVVVLSLTVALFVGVTFLGFFLVFAGGSLIIRFLLTFLASLSPFLVSLVDEPLVSASVAGICLLLATPVLASGSVWGMVRMAGRRLAHGEQWMKRMITPTLTTRGILELTALVAVAFALLGALFSASDGGTADSENVARSARFRADIFLAAIPTMAGLVLACSGLTIPVFAARLVYPAARRSWVIAILLAGTTLLTHTAVAVFLAGMPGEILAWMIACELATPIISLGVADLLARQGPYRLLRPSEWRRGTSAVPRQPPPAAPHPLDSPSPRGTERDSLRHAGQAVI